MTTAQIIAKAREILGRLTDLLNIGRRKGWWSKDR